MKYNVLLIEDDELSVSVIKRNLSFYPVFNLVGVMTTLSDAIQYLENNPVDVVFLDMQLPDGEGFNILPHIQGKPAIVVITSNEQYAFTAFEHGVLDFFKKSNTPNRFKVCVNKIVDYLQRQIPVNAEVNTVLFVKSGLKHIKIDIKELLYAEAENEYVKLYFTKRKPCLINISLKQLVTKLQFFNCIQVHRTFLVNVNQIDFIDDGMIVLNNAQQIPIGKTFKSDIVKFLR